MKKTPKQRREERKARKAAEALAAQKAYEEQKANPVKATRGDGTLHLRMHLMNAKHGCEECEKETNILYLVEGRYVCEDCKIKLTGNNYRVDLAWRDRVDTQKKLESAKLTNKTANELTNSFGDKITKGPDGFLLFMDGKQVCKSKRINRLRKEVKKRRKLKDRITWTKG